MCILLLLFTGQLHCNDAWQKRGAKHGVLKAVIFRSFRAVMTSAAVNGDLIGAAGKY